MRSAAAAAFIAVLALGACGGDDDAGRIDSGGLTSREIVERFDRAGLDAERPARLEDNELGVAPNATDDRTRFLIPSLGEDAGGRVFVFDNVDGLRRTKEAYDELGEGSGLLFSWTFANERRGVLVQINGDLPKAKAERYAAVVRGL